MTKLAVIAMFVGIGFTPLSPAPTNPLCYSNQAYRNTHEQECLIDKVPPPVSAGGGGGGGSRGLLGGLLHAIGGLL